MVLGQLGKLRRTKLYGLVSELPAAILHHKSCKHHVSIMRACRRIRHGSVQHADMDSQERTQVFASITSELDAARCAALAGSCHAYTHWLVGRPLR